MGAANGPCNNHLEMHAIVIGVEKTTRVRHGMATTGSTLLCHYLCYSQTDWSWSAFVVSRVYRRERFVGEFVRDTDIGPEQISNRRVYNQIVVGQRFYLKRRIVVLHPFPNI